jgi:hypothetical protein
MPRYTLEVRAASLDGGADFPVIKTISYDLADIAVYTPWRLLLGEHRITGWTITSDETPEQARERLR